MRMFEISDDYIVLRIPTLRGFRTIAANVSVLVFSVSCMWYHLITGEPSFVGTETCVALLIMGLANIIFRAYRGDTERIAVVDPVVLTQQQQNRVVAMEYFNELDAGDPSLGAGNVSKIADGAERGHLRMSEFSDEFFEATCEDMPGGRVNGRG